MLLADVSRWGYPAVLINLGVVMLIAVLLGAVLRLLDTRMPGGPPALPEPVVADTCSVHDRP